MPSFLERRRMAYREYAGTLTFLYFDDIISKEQYNEFLSKTKDQYDCIVEEIRRCRE